MRSIKKTTKRTAIVGGTVAALIGGGVAFAYWTTSGSGEGTGSTTAGSINSLSFDQTALTDMYPGDEEQDLTVTVTNTATESAYVSTVKAYITTDKVGCTGADFLLGGAAAPSDAANAVALTWEAQDLVAGGFTDASSTIQFNNQNAPQDACKSAAVTIHYLAS
jgi:hypothetical protein